MEPLNIETDIDTLGLEESTFDYWFSDHGHISCPFPEYMKEQLKKETCEAFANWSDQLSEEERGILKDQLLVGKFEQLLFEKAYALARTEDEKITILHPFIPRIGESINLTKEVMGDSESIVIDRKIIKAGQKVFLQVFFKNTGSGEIWDLMFQNRSVTGEWIGF